MLSCIDICILRHIHSQTVLCFLHIHLSSVTLSLSGCGVLLLCLRFLSSSFQVPLRVISDLSKSLLRLLSGSSPAPLLLLSGFPQIRLENLLSSVSDSSQTPARHISVIFKVTFSLCLDHCLDSYPSSHSLLPDSSHFISDSSHFLSDSSHFLLRLLSCSPRCLSISFQIPLRLLFSSIQSSLRLHSQSSHFLDSFLTPLRFFLISFQTVPRLLSVSSKTSLETHMRLLFSFSQSSLRPCSQSSHILLRLISHTLDSFR